MADAIPTPAVEAVSHGGPLLRIEQVVKRFGNVAAVDGLSLDIKAGEFFALLGPSGCGKTTLLRMLAGFEAPDAGRILLDGVDIAPMLPHQRPVNMMFQSYALFPHLSVAGNIAFGLKRAGMPRREIGQRVAEMVALVRLEGLETRKPDQLSGGQRQRVALARALARRPRVLLLDEPLGALDRKLRESTQRELLDLQRRLGLTFVVVTHDQDEAMTMADRIGVMNAGRLEQVATPRHLYEEPVSRWIAGFVGDVNMFDGKVARRDGGRFAVAVPGVGLLNATPPRDPAGVEAVSVAIRPEKVRLSRRPPVADVADASINRLEGVVRDIGYLGGASLYTVALDGDAATLRASVANTARLDADAFPVGQRIAAWFSADDCVVLER
ncbi:MAG: ABC transporter ATP-binding protein [Xanthobacteraceae bacterium]|nr:ABC transporter ATP-binding protein [Xanthobacteraceae bacterium]